VADKIILASNEETIVRRVGGEGKWVRVKGDVRYGRGKGKFTPEQATKAQRGSRGITSLLL